MIGQPKVFVSYATVDLQLAQLVKHELDEAGAEIWEFDASAVPGTDAWTSILETISKSDYFVVLLSSSAVASRAVQEEIRHAHYCCLNQSSPICIPVILELGVQVPIQIVKEVRIAHSAEDPALSVQMLKKAMGLDSSGLFHDSIHIEECREATQEFRVKLEVADFFSRLVHHNPEISKEFNSRVQPTRESAGGRFRYGDLTVAEWFVPDYWVEFRHGKGQRNGEYIFLVRQALLHGVRRGYSITTNILAKVEGTSHEEFVEDSTIQDDWKLVKSTLTLRFVGFRDTVAARLAERSGSSA
jgi:TIR domain